MQKVLTGYEIATLKYSLIFAVLLATLLALSQLGSRASDKHLSRGGRIYAANCQVCHRQGTNPLNPEKQLAESSKLISPSLFREFLSSKHGVMPKFQAIASHETDLKELYSFVKTLRNQSWEYPQNEPAPQNPPMKEPHP